MTANNGTAAIGRGALLSGATEDTVPDSASRSSRLAQEEAAERAARDLQEYLRRRDRLAAGEAPRRSDDDATVDELRGRIATHYKGLVESIARRFQSSGEPFDDLTQEGYLGLLSAMEHFDTTKNVKFSTYATHFIAGAIRHCLRDRGKIIKEPAWLHELNSRITRTTDSLTQKLGRAPLPAEVAASLNLTEEAVEEFIATRQVFRVAAFQTGPDDGSESMAGLVDPEKIRSDKYVTLQLPIEDRIVLEEAAQKLKALEQKVIYEFFYRERSQTEIARSFNISCNYVSHIIKNSTTKLKRILGEADVRDRYRTRESSIVETVSGLYTSAHLTSRIDEEISVAARAGHNVSILRVELMSAVPVRGADGDKVWSACGSAVRDSIRRMDMAGRFENNQIVVLLPKTGETCSVVADRIRNVLTEAGAQSSIRFSVEVSAAIYPNDGRNATELLAATA